MEQALHMNLITKSCLLSCTLQPDLIVCCAEVVCGCQCLSGYPKQPFPHTPLVCFLLLDPPMLVVLHLSILNLHPPSATPSISLTPSRHSQSGHSVGFELFVVDVNSTGWLKSVCLKRSKSQGSSGTRTQLQPLQKLNGKTRAAHWADRGKGLPLYVTAMSWLLG